MGWFMYKKILGKDTLKMKNSYYLSLKKIYLAALGLSFGTQGLRWIFTTAYGIQFPDQGSNPGPLH